MTLNSRLPQRLMPMRPIEQHAFGTIRGLDAFASLAIIGLFFPSRNSNNLDRSGKKVMKIIDPPNFNGGGAHLIYKKRQKSHIKVHGRQ
jgi:hypothetical protein